MVIINAYLGAGSGGGVPVGKCLLNVAWNPSDGNNKSGATVRAVIGSTTVTGTTDASGNASLLVGTGTCTVTVTPAGGSYTNLSASVTAESTTTKTVVINGQAGRRVTLVMPYTLTTTSWNIKNSSNVQQTSGSGAFNDKEVTLIDGTYTLSVTAYGVTKTKSFTVSASSVRIDCTDITCLVTFNLPASLAFTMKVATVSLASNQRFVCVLRNSAALAYSGTCTTQLDGSAIVTVTSANMTPSGATLTVTPTITGTKKLYTATKTISIPVSGWYKLFLIGGGGGGGSWAGGGSGHVVFGAYYIPSGSYAITIGAGGASGANGGATSFGNLCSAYGGGAPASYQAGIGGAGGGGYQSYRGGDATFGGGGGGGGSGTLEKIGGSAGMYGGKGGNRGSNGAAGRAVIRTNEDFFTSNGSSTAGGTNYGSSSWPNAGGGGGYGAKGGDAYYDLSHGGGGGGIAGGNGGNGGGNKNNDTAKYCQGGFGYGSGGGGCDNSSSTYGAGGGGGLYNIAHSTVKSGMNGACQIMWIG